MKKIKNWMPVIALAVVAVLAFGNSEKIKADDKDAGSAVVSQDAQTIADGVKIGSVDVSGMTGSDAKNAVTEYINSLKAATFTLTGAEDKTVEATAEDMGVTADVDSAVEKAQAVGKSGSLIRRYKETQDLKKSDVVIDMKLHVDKQKTANLLYANGDSLNVKAVNMGLKRENGAFTIIDGQDGQEVDSAVENMEQAVEAVRNTEPEADEEAERNAELEADEEAGVVESTELSEGEHKEE